MKTGISLYCYSELIKAGQITLFDAIKHAAKTGFKIVEFDEFTPPAGKSLLEYAGELRKACEAEGLTVANYAVGADFLNGSDGDAVAEIRRVKAQADVAKALGASHLRHDVTRGFKNRPGGGDYQEVIRLIAPAIREVSEYAARLGIKTMTENHGGLLTDSSRMAELVRAVNYPNYGILVDIGNFLSGDEESVKALANVLPFVFHVHAKDFLWKSGAEPKPGWWWFNTRGGNWIRATIVGHGSAQVAQVLERLKKAGFDGAVCLEFEGPEETYDAILRGYEFLERVCK